MAITPNWCLFTENESHTIHQKPYREYRNTYGPKVIRIPVGNYEDGQMATKLQNQGEE